MKRDETLEVMDKWLKDLQTHSSSGCTPTQDFPDEFVNMLFTNLKILSVHPALQRYLSAIIKNTKAVPDLI